MKNIKGLIESLEGTCLKTIESEKVDFGWKEDEKLTSEEYEEIDNEIFECQVCGWWYDVCEQGYDRGTCISCEEEFGEDFQED